MSASTDLERRLVRVRDPQLLAFECIALLLSVLLERLASTPSHGEAWHVLMPLFDAATDAVAEPLTTRAEHCADVRYQADRLASRYWSRVDARARGCRTMRPLRRWHIARTAPRPFAYKAERRRRRWQRRRARMHR